ncbi:hypothetical protein GQF04_11140 [Paenibacillus aceris]|uniref:DUF5348 domain-containing protein n=1 Tax=Paenibacillus aceris TaxID=869555 RepID=A0ABS4HRC5_9BACL|nr:hypothetical protein [Paenibacillus aceris]MBP1961169.1 hypothetical protein [Paenibacillus aceris]NHW35178.1 hypothetical protein [Paenibacillus aceris]
MEFTIIEGGIYEDTSFRYNTGDVVRVILDEQQPVFYGYIFTINDGPMKLLRSPHLISSAI